NKLFRQGKIDSAIKEYKKILGIKPNDLEIRRIIGDLQLKQNNLPGAVDQFEWIADYFLKEGFFAKAIAMYKRITRINPNYEGVSVKLAELYTKQGLIIEAKQIYLDLAEENKRKNNHRKALDMYKKILEFDRNNIKMRLLLADNYCREGLEENAVIEYITAADILMHKKDFQKAEELLLGTSQKIKSIKVVEKLIHCYTSRGNDKAAIELLKSLGSDLFKNVDLLKSLGELYFRNNQIDEAEKIFKKVTELSTEETEIIMKLGRVYLQRNEYDKTYELFLPVVETHIKEKKYEDATSLLRFIIASNNSYIPALKKLASIFKISGKQNNLIALYESLIPVYEQKEMKEELIKILEELIELSDSSFTYQEQLARITGKGADQHDEESEGERERELINFNLRVVEEAITESDYDKAIDILKKTASTFPNNIDVHLKLFDVYQISNDIDSLMDGGIELLKIYKSENNQDEFKKLLEKLYTFRPDDVRLAEYAGEEKTSIDIVFDKEDLKDNMNEISDPSLKEIGMPDEMDDLKDILVLSEEDSMLGTKKPATPEPEPEDLKSGSDSGAEKEDSTNLSSVFTELDFYINDGYFGDAEKLIEKLRESYPNNKELVERMEKLKQVRMDGAQESFESHDDLFNIKSPLVEENQVIQEQEDSKSMTAENKLDRKEDIKVKEPEHRIIDDLNIEIEMDESEEADDLPLFEIDKDEIIQSPSVESKETTESGFLSSSEDLFELGEDNKIVSKESPGPGFVELSKEKEKSVESELLDIESILKEGSKTAPTEKSAKTEFEAQIDSTFQDMDQSDIALDRGDEIFEGALLLDDDDFFEIEKVSRDELDSIAFWVQEVEKQRTSTVEKNMMEIFDEFKRGVEEKIGQEDYDTRYNLGIAYKEMGLIEEAIHEFQISSKHPLKYFDSAGLLGICFREKGIYDDAVSWLYKALEAPDRLEEEYLAIKYELVVTFKMKEDFKAALSIVREIVKKNPKFRDVAKIHNELSSRVTPS
ncbi:MAG: DUF2989 domain-containing protein, partial [Candidatus Aminicenantes bacterium]|nr:DUF2989 domain-containing protein [Candidatus Aminicenantes bacterium]